MISCVLWKVSWIIFGDGRLYLKQRKWHLTASKRWNYETTYFWMSGTYILWCWRLGVRNAIVLSVHANSDEWEKGSMRHWPHSRRKQSSLLPTADHLPNLIATGDGFRAGKLLRKTRVVLRMFKLLCGTFLAFTDRCTQEDVSFSDWVKCWLKRSCQKKKKCLLIYIFFEATTKACFPNKW